MEIPKINLKNLTKVKKIKQKNDDKRISKKMDEEKMSDKTYKKPTESSDTFIENGAISIVVGETLLKNGELSVEKNKTAVEKLEKNNEQWIERD